MRQVIKLQGWDFALWFFVRIAHLFESERAIRSFKRANRLFHTFFKKAKSQPFQAAGGEVGVILRNLWRRTGEACDPAAAGGEGESS